MSGANIIVVQHHKVQRDLLESLCNESPNYVEFFAEPADALYRILNDNAEVVVTGQKFYDRTQMRQEFTFKNGVVQSSPVIQYDKKSSGTDFARTVRLFKPYLMVFRYTSLPEAGNPVEEGFVGEIDKKGDIEPIRWFLNYPELRKVVRTRDWDIFRRDMPDGVRLFDEVANRYPRVVPLEP